MFNWIPTIETERLILRKKTHAIFKRIFEECNEKDQLYFFNFKDKKELIEEKERFDSGYESYYMSYIFWDILDKSSKKHLGACGYHTWIKTHNKAEIGYAITDESAKRKGFMSEAIVPIIQYGFEEMNLHRIEACISPNNTPSLKLVKKNGFVLEGIKKEDYLIDGVYVDSGIHALLKKNFIK